MLHPKCRCEFDKLITIYYNDKVLSKWQSRKLPFYEKKKWLNYSSSSRSKRHTKLRDGSQNKTTKDCTYLLVIHDPPTELTTWGDWFRCLLAPPCVGWACPRRRHSQCFGWRFLPKLCKWEREEKFDYLFEILPRISGQVC